MSQDHLQQAGKALFRALSRHADLILSAYLSGSVDESQSDPDTLDKLVRLGILWRPEADAELRLRRVLRALLEEGLQDVRNRQIDANLGSALTTLRTLTEHYKEARYRRAAVEADAYLADLREHVYGLTEGLRRHVRVLWERIHHEFGYVASIDAKIRENELAQTQVSELLNQLELIRFDQLGELAGQDRDLRRLLIVSLQRTFTEVAKELSLVQAKLIELIGRFREFQGRTRLLRGFLLHLEQHPDYRPRDVTRQSDVPQLFNQASAIITPAAINPQDSLLENELVQLVAALRTAQRESLRDEQDRQGTPFQLQENETLSLQEDTIRQAVDAYFCQVIDQGERLSALEYLAEHELDCDGELWLYRVIGGYEGLPDDERQFFELEHLTRDDPVFANQVIEDVALWLA